MSHSILSAHHLLVSRYVFVNILRSSELRFCSRYFVAYCIALVLSMHLMSVPVCGCISLFFCGNSKRTTVRSARVRSNQSIFKISVSEIVSISTKLSFFS